jgi:hypothetical protein
VEGALPKKSLWKSRYEMKIVFKPIFFKRWEKGAAHRAHTIEKNLKTFITIAILIIIT